MAGQLVAVVTLMSAFMTSIVIAREFERGTMDGLLSTNCTALEFLLSKIIPYYILSIMGATLALLTAFILYDLPFRGSFALFVLTILVYLYLTLLIGLIISAVTQNQFLSSEYAVIVSFLPSILLSGALFDLRSIPYIINIIAHFLPPVYAVESFKICILSGGSGDIVATNLLILAVYSALLTVLCYKVVANHFKRYPAQVISKPTFQEPAQTHAQTPAQTTAAAPPLQTTPTKIQSPAHTKQPSTATAHVTPEDTTQHHAQKSLPKRA